MNSWQDIEMLNAATNQWESVTIAPSAPDWLALSSATHEAVMLLLRAMGYQEGADLREWATEKRREFTDA